MKNKLRISFCAVFYIVLCILLVRFLYNLTVVSDHEKNFSWSDAYYLSYENTRVEFTPDETTLIDHLKNKKDCRLSKTLEEQTDSFCLAFDLNDSEVYLSLDGNEIFHSSTYSLHKKHPYTTQLVWIPGSYHPQTLEMDFRYFGNKESFVLPKFRIIKTCPDESTAFAFANRYGIRIGAFTIGLLFILGLFLISVARHETKWLLLLLVLCFSSLITNTIVHSYGEYFLPSFALKILSWPGFRYIPSHSILLFLLLNQNKAFWKAFLNCLKIHAVFCMICFLFSHIIHGPFYISVKHFLHDLFLHGKHENLALMITIYFVFLSTLIVLYCFIKESTYIGTQANTLLIKNDYMLNSYHSFRAGIMQENENKQKQLDRVNSMLLLCNAGDYKNLLQSLKETKESITESFVKVYTSNVVIDTLLNYYTNLFHEHNITFEPSVELTKSSTTVDTIEKDLYCFLLSLLTNALEAVDTLKSTEKRYVFLRIEEQLNCFTISSENPYDKSLVLSDNGVLPTTKQNNFCHGLGLRQMNEIAKKYDSKVRINIEGNLFILQSTWDISKL